MGGGGGGGEIVGNQGDSFVTKRERESMAFNRDCLILSYSELAN